MTKTSMSQRKTMGRVMHEYTHGELKSGRSGKAGKVKSRRQAIAIALKEAGASKYESQKENKQNLRKLFKKIQNKLIGKDSEKKKNLNVKLKKPPKNSQ